MTAVICVAALTCAAMIACVLTGAEIKKLHIPLYLVVTVIGAAMVLATGLLPLSYAVDALVADTSVNPIKILVLFLSITMLSVFLDETGFFQYMAAFALQKAGKSQIKLFIALYAVVSVLTVFTSNDIIILTFTPFVCYFCHSAKINPLPYLLGEFVAANTFSMMLVIGNPTNIYLALAEEITFGEYFSEMWLPTIFGGLTSFAVIFAIFYRQLKVKVDCAVPERIPVNKPLSIIGVIHLGACTVLLALSDLIGLPMWIISLGFAVCLFVVVTAYKLIRKEHFHELALTLHRAPWNFVPFLLSMFIIVTSLEYNGVTRAFAEFLGTENAIPLYGGLSALFSNLVNNIPMSVFFGSVLSFSGASSAAAYACIIGSNVGAFLTPVGALAGIMWSSILKRQGVNLGFGKFVMYGVLICIPTLAAALAGLWLLA